MVGIKRKRSRVQKKWGMMPQYCPGASQPEWKRSPTSVRLSDGRRKGKTDFDALMAVALKANSFLHLRNKSNFHHQNLLIQPSNTPRFAIPTRKSPMAVLSVSTPTVGLSETFTRLRNQGKVSNFYLSLNFRWIFFVFVFCFLFLDSGICRSIAFFDFWVLLCLISAFSFWVLVLVWSIAFWPFWFPLILGISFLSQLVCFISDWFGSYAWFCWPQLGPVRLREIILIYISTKYLFFEL